MIRPTILVLTIALLHGGAAIAATARAKPTPAEAVRIVGDFMVDQLQCRAKPNPTPALLFLEARGLLEAKKMKGADSISCWQLKHPLDVRGLAVAGVCAYEDDPLVVMQNSRFYWRGPGTSPGVLFSIVTNAPRAVVDAWADQVDIARKYIDAPYVLQDFGVEVTCNDDSRRD